MRKHSSKQGKRAARLHEAVDGALRLPVINTTLTTRRRMRYSGTSANVFAFGPRNLLDSQLVSTTATVLYDLYDFVRILEVELWTFGTNASAIPSPTNALIGFPGNVQGVASADGRQLVDSSLGLAPAHVKARPSKKSLASMWQVSTTTNLPILFEMQANRGDLGATTWILDVLAEFRTVMNFAPTPAQNAGVGLNVGDWYYRGLDGQPAATTLVVPQGVTNIA